MNNSFINSLIQKLPADSDYYRNTTILFPTKRACIYFKKALIKSLGNKNVWLPEVISIQDFLYQHIPTPIGNEQELLSILYQVHQEIIPSEQSFVEFYKWGQMILKDFSEVDQYLVDTKFLFHYVKSMKTIDESSALTPEQTKLLNQFWNTLPNDKNSDVKAQFIKTWNALDDIYNNFNAALAEKGITYEGQAYRMFLDLLENKEKKLNKRNFVIAGFNALSAFEERFFQHLISHYHTAIYWDADTSYLNNEDLEAGLFIRRYKKLFPEKVNHIISTSLGSATKNVAFVESPLEWTQVKYAIEKMDSLNPEETVLVLCDETLLYPLLEALPEEIPINITMGYPLLIHPIQTFIQYLLAFHQNKEEKNSISPSLFLKIIHHPLVKDFSKEQLLKIQQKVTQLGFVNNAIIVECLGTGNKLIDLMLHTKEQDYIYLLNVLNYLMQFEDRTLLDKKAFEATLQIVENLIVSIEENAIKLVIGELHTLLKNSLSSVKLPFKTAVSEGLQIMGFLETRNLDFKNVIILGATDNHLPGTNKSGSFIPYSIRKALSLPTFHENDAIYGYHFYRLLQRAEDITLVYANDIEKATINPSRFIEQINYEWSQIEGNKIKFHPTRIQIPLSKPKDLLPISVAKNNNLVQSKLNDYFEGNKQISASSLIQYLKCPFQFYLKYIAGVAEPEELVEEYDQRILGLVFHSAMELFYKPFLENKTWITSEILTQYYKQCNWEELLVKAFKENKINVEKHQLMGTNLLIKSIIQKLMEKVIQKDIELDQPFQIIGLEEYIDNIPFSIDANRKVFLKGTIDRVDRVKNADESTFTRIIDYKSGGITINSTTFNRKVKPIEQYMNEYFTAKDVKQGLQGYFYVYLYNSKHPNQQLTAGFYAAKAINSGLQKLRNGDFIDAEIMHLFEANLKDTLLALFDIDLPFTQTDNEKAYQYSAYKVLVE